MTETPGCRIAVTARVRAVILHDAPTAPAGITCGLHALGDDTQLAVSEGGIV